MTDPLFEPGDSFSGPIKIFAKCSFYNGMPQEAIARHMDHCRAEFGAQLVDTIIRTRSRVVVEYDEETRPIHEEEFFELFLKTEFIISATIRPVRYANVVIPSCSSMPPPPYRFRTEYASKDQALAAANSSTRRI